MNKQVSENPAAKNRVGSFSPLVVIATLMVASYLSANVMAVKLLGAWNSALIDAGTIIFPLSFVLGDVLTEVWGFKTARRIIFLTFICDIIFTAATYIAVVIPSPAYLAESAEAYNAVFAYVPRIVAASLAAFLCGELTNAYLMVRIKSITNGRFLWVRTIGSSALGYVFDSVIFCTIAFAGTVSLRDLLIMIAVQYVIKLVVEAVCGTPLCYAAVRFLRRRYM